MPPLSWERPARPSQECRLPEVRRAYRLQLLVAVAATVLFGLGVAFPALGAATALLFFVGLPMPGALVLGAAISICLFAVLVRRATNWLAVLGDHRFERAVALSLERRFGRRDGFFVGVRLSPTETFATRFLDSHEDVGMVFLDEGALVFEGMRNRVVIDRESVTHLSTTPVQGFAHLGALFCAVHHGDTPLFLESRRKRTIRQNVQDTLELGRAIGDWAGAA